MDRVLAYPSLPSLPGVAVRVLELTRNPKVSMQEIAQTVSMDPALATKVLKTVNSSYYGLPQPCPSIPRAMSMLGMNTVKSIVLGFSLVEMTKSVAGAGEAFDLEAYWRRAVYSAVAARSVAFRAKCCDPEEAFTGSMIADIGMLACFAALRDEYTTAMGVAPDDHSEWVGVEREALGFDHAKLGQALATKWKLPPQLAECVGFHHEPAACHPQHEKLLRCIGVGQAAAAVLSVKDAKKKLGAFVVLCRDGFEMDRAACDALLEATSKGAQDLAKSLELKTGERPDVGAILSQAQEAIVETQLQSQQQSEELRKANEELARKTITDALTGAYNRAHFDATLAAAFAHAKKTGTALSLLFFDADRFKSVNDTLGHQAGDAVLKELSRRTRGLLSSAGTVCRYGGEEFAIILPGVGMLKAGKIAELLRTVIARTPFDLRACKVAEEERTVTISIGVSSLELAFAELVATPEALTKAADEGVYAAKKAGRNRVQTVAPKRPGEMEGKVAGPSHGAAAAAAVPAATKPARKTMMMLVEDDPLAAKLLGMLFAKHPDFSLITVNSAEDALAMLADASMPAPHCILCDMNLPGVTGVQFIKTCRSMLTQVKAPIVLVSASMDAAVAAQATAAGAARFINKAKLVSDFDATIRDLRAVISQPALAA
jgi:diguanylate cyclase (GGDEF)-like protein